MARANEITGRGLSYRTRYGQGALASLLVERQEEVFPSAMIVIPFRLCLTLSALEAFLERNRQAASAGFFTLAARYVFRVASA